MTRVAIGTNKLVDFCLWACGSVGLWSVGLFLGPCIYGQRLAFAAPLWLNITGKAFERFSGLRMKSEPGYCRWRDFATVQPDFVSPTFDVQMVSMENLHGTGRFRVTHHTSVTTDACLPFEGMDATLFTSFLRSPVRQCPTFVCRQHSGGARYASAIWL